MIFDRDTQRENAFQTWWDTCGQPYEAAVITNGGTPWTTDLDERRALWMRRYTRPAPPKGLFHNLSDIRKPEYCTVTPAATRASHLTEINTAKETNAA